MTRKEAREYIIKHCNPHRDTSTQWDDAMECAIKALGEPERKKGKWIYDGSGLDYACSACKKSLGDYVFFTEDGELAEIPNFCPHCGADMRRI